MGERTVPAERFAFAFAASYRLPAFAFGIMPGRAWVEVDASRLSVRFGPWSLQTPLLNIASTTLTGDFAFLKTAGPPHLSLADSGITFATNGARALCLELHHPVAGIEPTGRLKHRGVTLTVADPEALRHAVGR